jgi:hypothetical protein
VAKSQRPDTRLFKQSWKCHHCGHEGWVFYAREEDALSVEATIAEQHSIMNEDCYIKTGVGGVRRIGAAELVEWR